MASPTATPSFASDGDHRLPLLQPGKPSSGRKLERLGVDDMLQKYCGEFGLWQLRHFVLTSLAWALEAFHSMVMIFADSEPAAWTCQPGVDACRPTSSSVCGMERGSWEWVGGPGGSTASEWGLICGEKYKVGLVQALFFGGCMIGAGVFGHLSDSFLGRKGSLMVICILNAVFGFVTALSPDYWTYCLLRLLTGFATGGVGLCAFVLATEPIGPLHRGLAGMCTFHFFSFGIALLSAVAYFFRSWRALYVASSVPSLLFVLAVVPFLSESPRWYLVRGKSEEALKVMHRVAAANGKALPDGAYLALDNTCEVSDDGRDQKGGGGGSLVDVIRSPLTRLRLFLAVAINFLCSVVYYGISLNVVNLDTNLYLNVALNAVAEMPAYAITALLLHRFGRKPLAVGTMWFSGVFCMVGSVTSAAVVGNWKTLRMACGILGIFGMAGTYNLLFIYTTELFPTVVRNAALGCASQAVQMGAILAPVVVVMGGGLPFLVFSVCGIAGGVLSFYLPETLNKPLYDTMAGMEDGEKAAESAVMA